MNENEIRKLVDEWTAAWNAHDTDRIKNIYAEDVTLYQAAVGKTLVGREHVIARLKDIHEMSEDGRVAIRELHVDGNTAILWTRASGSQTGRFLDYQPTGRRFEFETCLIFKFREDGKIVEHTTFLDTATILRALGLITVSGVRPEAA